MKPAAISRLEFIKSTSAANHCWIWPLAKDNYGYGSTGIDGRTIKAHRLSYELFVGKIAKGMCILHSCDVRACVNPAHLRQGTNEENIKEAAAKKRMNHGEKIHTAKLTNKQVMDIFYDPRNQTELAKIYGVAQPNIWRIKRGVHALTRGLV